LPISYRGAIVIAIPALCMGAMIGSWVWSRQVNIEVRQRIDHTKEVILESNKLLTTLVNAETGIRGYDLSRQTVFLYPYKKAKSHLSNNLGALDKLVRNDPEQSLQLDKIELLITNLTRILEARLLEINNSTINKNSVSDKNISMLKQGKQTMDTLRTEIGNLQQVEQQLLDKQKSHLAQLIELTSFLQWLTALVSSFAYLAAVYLFSKINTELAEREKQLSESKSLIDTITKNVVDGVITLNCHGVIETFNCAATKIFGYKPEEIIGKNLSFLLSDPCLTDQEKNDKLQFLTHHLRQLDKPWQTLGYRRSGECFPLEISLSEIPLNPLFIVIIRDISEAEEAKAKLTNRADELARLSATLTATNIQLEKQNQELDKFVYVASHDLKAPLRAIASLSEWIEEDLKDKLSEENNRQMELLRGRVHRLERLINGLLAYSRIGRIETRKELVDVRELLGEVIASLDPHSEFIIEIGEKMPVFKTKKKLLSEVFTHLLSNAIRHHDTGRGHIQILVREEDLFYHFQVIDDGPGIAPAYHERVFVIFQTLLPRDTKENTGIGLSLAKKILETEGGKIWLESEEHLGSTFHFTWPKS
jgi:PAS domain S-box-containing protein